MKLTRRTALEACALGLGLLLSQSSPAVIGATDNVPAATLLLPYFEVSTTENIESRLPQTVFEVRVPGYKTLDHVELVGGQNTELGDERAFAAAAAKPAKRFDRKLLDKLLNGGERMMAVRAQASSVLLHNTGPSNNRMDIVLIGVILSFRRKDNKVKMN